MRLRHTFILSLFMLNGCSILPGMENINTSKMRHQSLHETVADPVLIPINNTLLASLTRRHPYAYLIESPDTLNISIWKHPEFDFPLLESRSSDAVSHLFASQFNYPVSPEGNIYFPLLGNVPVAGKTLDQIRRDITLRLSKYIRHPQVLVRIADYRSKKVYVLGEVEKPGLLYINDQLMTAMDALTLSGSIDPNTGDPRYTYIIRGSLLHPRIYWLNANTADNLLLAQHFELQANDIIYVSTAVVTRWNRFLSQLLPSLQTVWYTKAITGK